MQCYKDRNYCEVRATYKDQTFYAADRTWWYRCASVHCCQEHWRFLLWCSKHEQPSAAHLSCSLFSYPFYWTNSKSSRSKKNSVSYSPWQWKLPAIRHFRPPSYQTRKSTKRCWRLVTKTKKYDHFTTVLIDLHWLPIKQRSEYKLLLLTFRSLHGLAASYIIDLLIRYEPTRALRSADAHLLEVPRCRLRTQGEKAFSSAAPRLWNNLPLAICATDCFSSFKKQLKTFLFFKQKCLQLLLFTLKEQFYNIRTVLISTIYQLFYYLVLT